MRSRGSFVAGLIAAAFLMPGLFGQGPSVDGDWELSAKTQQGEAIWKVLFARDGENLSVTMTGPKGNEIKGTGSLRKDRIEWTVKVPTPRGEMKVAYTGVVLGDGMAGEVQRGNLGKFEWSARRKPPGNGVS